MIPTITEAVPQIVMNGTKSFTTLKMMAEFVYHTVKMALLPTGIIDTVKLTQKIVSLGSTEMTRTIHVSLYAQSPGIILETISQNFVSKDAPISLKL